MKILLLDIETAPNLAYVWGTWKQNISMDKIVAKGHVLCWSAKWYGEESVMFSSIQEGQKTMLRKAHKLLSNADAVVHYNGKSFDIPTLNREFATTGLGKPNPFKQIDLLEVVRDNFNFPINKLDYVLQAFKLGKKVRHAGFQMWVDCMDGDEDAWEQMEEYNKGDVIALEPLYTKLRPWIRNHPNLAAYGGDSKGCTNCGSTKLQKRGTRVLRDSKYQQYQCQDCGTWMRDTKRIGKAGVTLYGVG